MAEIEGMAESRQRVKELLAAMEFYRKSAEEAIALELDKMGVNDELQPLQ